jgi:hypothetical protein
MTFQPGYAAYTQGFGTAPAGVSFPFYGAVAPTSANVQGNFGTFQLGQWWIVPNVGAWVLVGLTTSGGALSATWEQAVSASGDVLSVTGTANQILASPTTGNVVLSLIGPYTPATYTAHGVLVGEGTSSIVATAAGTTGQVLTATTSADPAFAALGTNSGLTAHGVLLGEGNSAIVATAVGSTGQVLTGSTGADPAFAALGTNSGLTAHGVLLGEGNSAIAATAAGSSGQFLVSGGASADPTWQTATPQLTVTPVAGASQAMTSNHSYIANDSAQTTFTLPATSAVGDIIQIIGSSLNTGGWTVTYTTNQIIWGPAGHSTLTSGAATSASAAAQVMTIVCTVANTIWVITNNSGTITLS